MVDRQKWKKSRDPLFRGDRAGGVALPDPTADPSIVRHILYFEGPGRPTPYLSTTEFEPTARRFAGKHGVVYESWPRTWSGRQVRHISRRELLQNLKGRGKGRASWPSAYEVAMARRYVEEHAEHLADFSGLPSDGLRARVDALFTRRGRR